MYDVVNIMFKNISAIDISNITQEENIEKLSKIIEEQEFIKYKEIPLDLEQELIGDKNLYISESKVDIELIK